MRVADPVGRGRLALFFDLDHDRYADLFLANRPDRTDGLPSRHRVLANPTGDHYEPRSSLDIDAAGGADCVVAADLDRDGWEDVVLCQRAIGRPDGQGIRVLRNVRGRLVDVTRRVGIPTANVVDAFVADMDRDRVPDIIQITPWELRVLLRRGDRYVTGYRRALTSAVSVAAGDVNGDGRPDLYVAQGTMDRQVRDLMLVNNGIGQGLPAHEHPPGPIGHGRGGRGARPRPQRPRRLPGAQRAGVAAGRTHPAHRVLPCGHGTGRPQGQPLSRRRTVAG